MSFQHLSILAVHIADEIKLKHCKLSLPYTIISESSSELFYSFSKKGRMLILHYGVIVFSNITEEDIQLILNQTQETLVRPFSDIFKESYTIRTSKDLKCYFDNISVPHITEAVLKNVMLNLAQSVALDYYLDKAEKILSDVTHFTEELEAKGKISISQRNTVKFLGKVLNVKNKIMENLYIFDAPESVWNDEYVDSVNTAMVHFFDLRVRFKEIEQTLRVIEDNLHALIMLSHHKESSRLEWIIIILILIEIIFYFF